MVAIEKAGGTGVGWDGKRHHASENRHKVWFELEEVQGRKWQVEGLLCVCVTNISNDPQ